MRAVLEEPQTQLTVAETSPPHSPRGHEPAAASQRLDFGKMEPPEDCNWVAAKLVRDTQACLPIRLGPGDLLYLLTPVVVPLEPSRPGCPPHDPFEPLGRALAKRHPWVRHVPYMAHDGLTRYHAEHLALAKAVIFVISGPRRGHQPAQVELAQIARSMATGRPQIVLACCDIRALGPIDNLFSTLVETIDYTRPSLEAAAELLFRRRPSPDRTLPLNLRGASVSATWRIGEWKPERDSPQVCELARQCLPAPFILDDNVLHGLLHRPGYAKHFVVLEPSTNEVIGFCATYTTFIDNSDSSWIGSLALLLVQPAYRNCGVGTALHSHALQQLALHRVSRLQLGSTYPRLLYGIPTGMTFEEEWFRRRGWQIDSMAVAGAGQEACDWVLDLGEWRAERLASRGLEFFPCHPESFDRVLEFVAREAVRLGNVGSYDQYYQLAGSPHMADIQLGFEGSVLVATAIIYIPSRGGRAAADLPWARTISDDTGGLCCICITDDHLSPAHTRDSVLIRLLDHCVKFLRGQGMRKMFMDAIRGGYEGYETIGFQKWASYRDVWCEA